MAIKKIKDKIRIKNILTNILKNNKRLFLGFLIGLILSSSAVYGATILFDSDDVSYNDSKVTSSSLGASTVQDALDVLYDKASNCGPSLYAFVNITNGTVDASSKKASGDGTATFTITPTTDYGCDPNIDECVSYCSNGTTHSVSANAQTFTLSGLRRNTECGINLVRNNNFSYRTVTIKDNDLAYFESPVCCSSSMPSFSDTYGTFKVVGSWYSNLKHPLKQYCTYSIPEDNVVYGESCTLYSTKVEYVNACVTASTTSNETCAGVMGSIYTGTSYVSNREHACRNRGYTNYSRAYECTGMKW